MGDPFDGKSFPRGPLIAAAVLVGVTILLAATARQSGVGTTRVAPSRSVAAYELHFTDRADGGVLVEVAANARDSEPRRIGELAPNTNGFARGVLRSLAHERRRLGLGPERPFVLTRYADGRLSLADPTTGQHVDLEVFGPTNAGVFASLWLAADAAAAASLAAATPAAATPAAPLDR